MTANVRRIPHVPDARITRQIKERYTWENFIAGRRVFEDAETGGIDLRAVLVMIILVRRLYRVGYDAYRNRWPKEGRGSRKAEHSASGRSEAWSDAGATVLREFAMAYWREKATTVNRHTEELVYWKPQAERILYDVEEMLGHIGWVFVLQKLLGGEPGSGTSYTEDEEE